MKYNKLRIEDADKLDIIFPHNTWSASEYLYFIATGINRDDGKRAFHILKPFPNQEKQVESFLELNSLYYIKSKTLDTVLEIKLLFKNVEFTDEYVKLT